MLAVKVTGMPSAKKGERFLLIKENGKWIVKKLPKRRKLTPKQKRQIKKAREATIKEGKKLVKGLKKWYENI